MLDLQTEDIKFKIKLKIKFFLLLGQQVDWNLTKNNVSTSIRKPVRTEEDRP